MAVEHIIWVGVLIFLMLSVPIITNSYIRSWRIENIRRQLKSVAEYIVDVIAQNYLVLFHVAVPDETITYPLKLDMISGEWYNGTATLVVEGLRSILVLTLATASEKVDVTQVFLGFSWNASSVLVGSSPNAGVKLVKVDGDISGEFTS
jgi:hypothetical protein